MNIEEARAVWLTTLGSGWVDEATLVVYPFGSPLDQAHYTLYEEHMFEHNPQRFLIKIKCRS